MPETKRSKKYGALKGPGDLEAVRALKEPGDLEAAGKAARCTTERRNDDRGRCCTAWRRLTFGYAYEVIDTGRARALDFEDLPPLGEQWHTATLHGRFECRWQAELARGRVRIAQRKKRSPVKQVLAPAAALDREARHRPRLWFALFKAFCSPLAVAAALRAVSDTMPFAAPLVLKAIILYLERHAGGTGDADLSEGLFYVGALGVISLLQSLCGRHYQYYCGTVGMGMRAAVASCVYRKCLVMSTPTVQRHSVGQVINLMSVDAQRLQDNAGLILGLFFTLYQLIIAVTLLWRELGIATIAAVALLSLALPVLRHFQYLLERNMQKLMKLRDRRVKITNEVVQAAKVIKINAWEEEFYVQVQDHRAAELKTLRWFLRLKAVYLACTVTLPIFVGIASFSLYASLGNTLGVASSLTALSLLAQLRAPLFGLPQVLNAIAVLRVSLTRLSSFLLDEDIEVPGPGMLLEPGVHIDHGTFIWDGSTPSEVKQAGGGRTRTCFTWCRRHGKGMAPAATQRPEKESLSHGVQQEESLGSEAGTRFSDDSSFKLSDVCMQLKPGTIHVVVGPVGAGKSSLLNAMLGEMPRSEDCDATVLSIQGSIALCPQEVFIRNATIRDNVLLGLPFDAERYASVVEACALLPDFAMLPAGDATEVGERGITLSGGQKARIALARAVYSDADVTLLDDCLAAVDAHVAAHIRDSCIIKMFANEDRNKTVVMVTNGIEHLFAIDAALPPSVQLHVVILNDGRIVQQGTFKELRAAALLDNETGSSGDSTFANLLHVHLETNRQASEMIGDAANGAASKGQRPQLPEALPKSPTEKEKDKAVDKTGADAASGQLVKTEQRGAGQISNHNYTFYLRKSGGWGVAVLLFVLNVSAEAVSMSSQWWLSYWAEHAEDPPEERLPLGLYMGVYLTLGLVSVLVFGTRYWNHMMYGVHASAQIYDIAFRRVLSSPMSFFDTTPTGRINNRLSNDVTTLDDELPDRVMAASVLGMRTLGIVCAISLLLPPFLVPCVVIFFLFQRLKDFFIPSIREVRRIESVVRSPLYAHFGETLNGLSTIRAFRRQELFVAENDSHIDKTILANFYQLVMNSWLGIRLQVLGALVSVFTAFCAVMQHLLPAGRGGGNPGDRHFPALAGLAIGFSLTISQWMQELVWHLTDLQAKMVCIERLQEYCQLEQERDASRDDTMESEQALSSSPLGAPAHRHYAPVLDPDSDWPSAGRLELRDVFASYREGLDNVFKGLTVTFLAGERIGICGRTGAGKSSLVMLITRLLQQSSGAILIDGVDTARVPLRRLRSSISVIVQDPLCFGGTLRANVDPLRLHSDAVVRSVLHSVDFLQGAEGSGSDHSKSGPSYSLDFEVAERGANLSAGQRQLLCIARAMLRRNRIIILDEATSSMDVATDALVQKAVRVAFVGATVLAIAHRLNTIMDYDKVLVLEQGRVLEYAGPSALLADDGSSFSQLAAEWRRGTQQQSTDASSV